MFWIKMSRYLGRVALEEINGIQYPQSDSSAPRVFAFRLCGKMYPSTVDWIECGDTVNASERISGSELKGGSWRRGAEIRHTRSTCDESSFSFLNVHRVQVQVPL